MASLEAMQIAVVRPIDHQVVALPVKGLPSPSPLCPTGAFELNDTAKSALAVGDEERLAVRRECHAAKRAEEIEDLFRLEGLRVDDADVVVCFCGDEDTGAGADRREAEGAGNAEFAGEYFERVAPVACVPDDDGGILRCSCDVDAVVCPSAREGIVGVGLEGFERSTCFRIRNECLLEITNYYAHSTIGTGCRTVDRSWVVEVVYECVGGAVQYAQTMVVGAEHALWLVCSP